MKRSRKKNIFAVLGALIVAVCFCSLNFLVPKERIKEASAESAINDLYRIEYGFNLLNPDIWNLPFHYKQDVDRPLGYYVCEGAYHEMDWKIGRYVKDESLSSVSEVVRLSFYQNLNKCASWGYYIRLEFFKDNALFTTMSTDPNSGMVGYLPPLSLWDYIDFYMVIDSTVTLGVDAVFAPYLGVHNGYSFVWNPYFSGSASELEEARQEGYEEGRQEGYEEGRQEGYEEGHESGYNSGLEYAKAGYFNDVLITYEIVTANGVIGANTIKPTVVADGVRLGNLYSELYEYSLLSTSSPILSVNWYITFREFVPFKDFQLGVICPESYVQTIDGSIKRYEVEVVTPSNSVYYILGRFLEVENNSVGYRFSVGTEEGSSMPVEIFQSYNYSVSAIMGFTTYDITDFFNFQFVGFGASSYDAGFTVGYNQAQVDLKETIHQEGYAAGVEEGKLLGYDGGYADGFAKATSSDPYSLSEFVFTYLDMPGRILYNWLNFDFMGFNLAGVLALLISALIVAYVWKKVT